MDFQAHHPQYELISILDAQQLRRWNAFVLDHPDVTNDERFDLWVATDPDGLKKFNELIGGHTQDEAAEAEDEKQQHIRRHQDSFKVSCVKEENMRKGINHEQGVLKVAEDKKKDKRMELAGKIEEAK